MCIRDSLKKATSKNIENLQETVKLQQTYTTALCTHVNVIHAKLAQLENQFQTYCIYPHPQTDSVQIEALEYDSDIDEHLDQWVTLPHSDITQAEATPVNSESEENSEHLQNSHGTESRPIYNENTDKHLPQEGTEPISEHYQEDTTHKSEDIPELEDKDWKDGQFADVDLIDRHNTIHKSTQTRILCSVPTIFRWPL